MTLLGVLLLLRLIFVLCMIQAFLPMMNIFSFTPCLSRFLMVVLHAFIFMERGVIQMRFTLNEWNFILHCLSVAAREYEKQMNKSPKDDDENSSYQIFRRQFREARRLIDFIENSEI